MGKQKEDFSHMIASTYNQELHYTSWESVIRGNDLMMTELNNTANEMLVSKAKSGMVDPTRQIVFSFFHEGKTSTLGAKEFRFYNQTLLDLKLLPSTDGSGSGVKYHVLPCYNKDNPAFMPHK